MFRSSVVLASLLLAAPAFGASTTTAKNLKDLYYGEALYYAYQGKWFEAIDRLDPDVGQFHGLGKPERDSLFIHVGRAVFNVGDFELNYRMHQRAGRAINAVIDADAGNSVRNEAIFRLARMYFREDQPEKALHTVKRIRGAVPEKIRADLAFLRANIAMANDRNAAAVRLLKDIQNEKSLEGFSSYNLGIALLRKGNERNGRENLDRAGRIESNDPAVLAIKDKANLVLGEQLLSENHFEAAKEVLDRVRLSGPFSNRALLSSGWADASREWFKNALVPWSILADREVTDPAVQEAMLAVAYAYGKLGVYSTAALKYETALEAFGREVGRLGSSITSIREGKFLKALVREELKQDGNWVARLRKLPETSETRYLLTLMASQDFRESLKNYLDLEELRKKLEAWSRDLAAFEDLLRWRWAHYQPLLPDIDRKFRRLQSRMRLRMQQRDGIEQRLKATEAAPRPDLLLTTDEHITNERVARLEKLVTPHSEEVAPRFGELVRRLRGVLNWNIYVEYDKRLTDARKHFAELNQAMELLNQQYASFVRTRQDIAETYQGYVDTMRRQRLRIKAAGKKVRVLTTRQGQMLETIAMNELTRRHDRLEEFQVKARFALADSYDRAGKAELRKGDEQ